MHFSLTCSMIQTKLPLLHSSKVHVTPPTYYNHSQPLHLHHSVYNLFSINSGPSHTLQISCTWQWAQLCHWRPSLCQIKDTPNWCTCFKSIRTIFVEFCCAVTWDNVKSHSGLHLWSNSVTSNILYYLSFWSHSDFLPLLWSSYLLICFVPFLFAPALLILSTPSCSHLWMTLCNPVPSCSCSMCWLEPHVALTLPLLFSHIFFPSGPYFPNLLYLSLYLVWYKPIQLLCSIVYLLFICILLVLSTFN